MDRPLSEYVESSIKGWTIEYRVHATQRMFKRRIDDKDVIRLLDTGIIIEEYQEDFPFPSVLIKEISCDNRPLHCVIGIDAESKRFYLITIYEPDHKKWSNNYTKRLSP